MENLINLARKSLLYDQIYEVAEQLLKEFNPCRASCTGCRAGDFCCHGCEHLGEKGCTVKALTCKLWLCTAAYEESDIINANFYQLKKLAREEGLSGCRNSKEQILSQWT